MITRLLSIVLLSSFLTSPSWSQEQVDDAPDNPLKVLEGFVGKTWKAEVSPPGSDEKLFDLSRWEWILDGQAIRIRHSVGDGVYSGETLLTWDHRAQTIAYMYATTGGFFTRGTMKADETFFDATEIVVGNADGVVGLRSTGELLPDGTLQVISSSRTRSGWMDADTTNYIVVPDSTHIMTGTD